MEELRVPIFCVRCGHRESEIITARVVFCPDMTGRRVHRQTHYTLRCAECGHVFEKTEELGTPPPD